MMLVHVVSVRSKDYQLLFQIDTWAGLLPKAHHEFGITHVC